MIKLRLDLLDAFIRSGAREIESYFTAGGLVLVDLTDPFLDGEWLHIVLSTITMLTCWNLALGLTAAVLFDAVLGAFTQWQTVCGKLVGESEHLVSAPVLTPFDLARSVR
jgi:hypothetical protein